MDLLVENWKNVDGNKLFFVHQKLVPVLLASYWSRYLLFFEMGVYFAGWKPQNVIDKDQIFI